MKLKKIITQSLAETSFFSPEEAHTCAETLSAPPQTSMGDLAVPCFPLAAKHKKSPAAIAVELTSQIKPNELIERAQTVGPYVNLILNRPTVTKIIINEVLHERENYGRLDLGKNQKVVIDFSHPNIAKPFHFGHLRSTNLGADLSRIFNFTGYDVFRKNYLGDWGTQFGLVIYAWQKYGSEDLLSKEAINHLVNLYIRANQEAEADTQVWEKAKQLFQRLENHDPEIHSLWKRFRELSIQAFQKTYKRLGTQFDSYEGEASISPKVNTIIDRFIQAGIARQQDGAIVVEVSDLLNREMSPLVLRKSDGSSTYGARDCAEALNRWENHQFALNLYVVSRQDDYFTQVFTALKKLALAEQWEINWAERCEFVSFGFVKGMSTRKGTVVWLDDVLNEARDRARQIRLEKMQRNPSAFPELSEEELEQISEAVGLSAILYFDVSAQRLRDIVFDWDTVLNFEGNTGPYLQYTHARIAGIFRKSSNLGNILTELDDLNWKALTSNEEWQLVMKLREIRTALNAAVRYREPFYIAQYGFQLCSIFNNFYNNHRVINPDDPTLTQARLALCASVQIVLRNTLNLLGIKPLEVM